MNLLKSSASSALALAAIVTGLAINGEEAKAGWTLVPPYTYQNFDSPAPDFGHFDATWSPWLGDKRMKVLNGGIVDGMTTGPNDIEWSYKPGSPLPWHVDLDQTGVINSASSFLYRLQIDSTQDGLNICSTFNTCFPFFNQAQFGIQAADPSLTVKTIYEAIGDTKGATLLTLTNGQTKTLPNGYSDIIVEVSWGANNAIGDISDNYNQVPTPLPILGVGAAYGSIRKMRKISTQLKAHPMG